MSIRYTRFASSDCSRVGDIISKAISVALDSINKVLMRFIKNRLKVRKPEILIDDLTFYGNFLSKNSDVFTFLLCDPRRNSVGFLTKAINCAEELLLGRDIDSRFKRSNRGDIMGHFENCPIFIVEYSIDDKWFEQVEAQIRDLYNVYNNLIDYNKHRDWFETCVINQEIDTFHTLNPFASEPEEFKKRGGLAVAIIDSIPEDLDRQSLYERFYVRRLRRGFVEFRRKPYIIIADEEDARICQRKFFTIKRKYFTLRNQCRSPNSINRRTSQLTIFQYLG